MSLIGSMIFLEVCQVHLKSERRLEVFLFIFFKVSDLSSDLGLLLQVNQAQNEHL